MQSRKQSLWEAVVNILIGYSITFVANAIVLPLFGFDISVKQNLSLGLIYTLISLTRSYCIRRYYNRRHRNA